MLKNSRLRIAQVSPLWTRIPPATYGGIELVMKLLIDELVVRGHEVTLFSSGDCGTSAQLHETVDRNLTARVIAGETEMFEHYANSAMAEVMREAGRFDLIHYHLSTAWLPLAGVVGTPGLFSMHASPRVDDEWAMGRWPAVEVAGVSACQMRAAGLKLRRKFPVVYNGCDFGAYAPRFAPGSYLAFLGRLSADKNPLGAIRIAQEVGMPLVIAGQPQNQKELAYFKKEVEPLIDGEQIRWIGPVNHEQKNELLAHAAALLFPIQWEEPFGLVMIEAMACGTPVVALRRGSVGEVVDDGVTGYTADDVEALPGLVAPALALDRELVRARAEVRFGYRRMVDDYVALYRALVAR